MGRIFWESRNMKTEPTKVTRPSAPIPAPRNVNRTKNDRNNNVFDTTSIENGINKLTLKPHRIERLPDKIKNESKCDEADKNNGNKANTDELANQLSKISIVEKVHVKLCINKETEGQDVHLICSKANESTAPDGKCVKIEKNSDDDLCSRGPTRPEVFATQRLKSLPYQLPTYVNSRNRTDCGGKVYLKPSSIGSDEESYNFDQLNIIENTQQACSPPYNELQVSPQHGSSSEAELDTIWKLDPGFVKHLETYCNSLLEDNQGSGNLETPPVHGLQSNSPTPNALIGADPLVSANSPQMYPESSPEQHNFVRSPQQVVPTFDTWQESKSIDSLSSSPSFSQSNPTSPFLVPLQNNPADRYLNENYFPTDLITEQENSLDDLDFALPEHPVMLYVNDKPESQSPKYTPILCSPSPDQVASPLNSQYPTSPADITQNLYHQTTTTGLSEFQMLSPNGYSPLSTSPAKSQGTESLSSPITHNSLKSVSTSQLTLVSVYPNIHNLPCTSPNTINGQSPVSILISGASHPPPHSPKQSRPRPILPASKDISVPSREILLQQLNPLKRKEAWLKVNLKPNKYFIEGDQDGDTPLMIVVSQKRDDLFELVYAMVEYLRRRVPDALNLKNKRGQSALYNACIALNEHPLVALYLAETLLSLGVNIAKDKFPDKFNGYSTLLECVKQLGESHNRVLKVLSSLKTTQGSPVFTD